MLQSVPWSQRWAGVHSLGRVPLLCMSAHDGEAAANGRFAVQQEDDNDDSR